MEDKIKIGIIGCGGMGHAHVKAVLKNPNFEFVGACDINPGALNELPASVHRYGKVEELFDNEEIELVSIIVPNHLYEPYVSLAAAHGVSVFCEKPFGVDENSCLRMIEKIKENALKGWVSSQKKYLNSFVEGHRRLQGRQVDFVQGIMSYYWEPAFGHIGWRGDKEKSGGIAVIDSGWHVLDLLSWFIGEPESVFAQLTYLKANPGIDDKASIILKYPTGIVADLVISYTIPVKRFEFVFTSGTSCLCLSERFDYYEKGKLVESLECESDDNPFDKMYRELKKAYLGDSKAYITDLDRAARIMKVVSACYQSAEKGEIVIL